MRSVAVFVKGPGAGRESALRALQTAGFKVTLDPRRHAHPAQRLPSAEAPPRVAFVRLRRSRKSQWLVTSVPFASSAAARARSSTSRASAATPRNARTRVGRTRRVSTARAASSSASTRVRLREKQKVRRVYGVLERQFSGYFQEASRRKGRTGEEMLALLERRLDSVVYRLGFASSRAESRQLVMHGHVKVNGKRLDIPSYVARLGDKIDLTENARKFKFVLASIAGADKRPNASWLEIDRPNFTGTVKTARSARTSTSPRSVSS